MVDQVQTQLAEKYLEREKPKVGLTNPQLERDLIQRAAKYSGLPFACVKEFYDKGHW